MTPPLAQLESAARLVDKAAQEDMKWWFLALLVLGVVVIWLVARYWAEQHKALGRRLDVVQDAHTSYLTTMNERLVTVLTQNTEATKHFSETVAAARDLFIESGGHQNTRKPKPNVT